MKKDNINFNQLKHLITFFKNQDKNKTSKKWRKVTQSDLFGQVNQIPVNKVNTSKKSDKVSSFRMQKEFGEKNDHVEPTVTTPNGQISETLMSGSLGDYYSKEWKNEDK